MDLVIVVVLLCSAGRAAGEKQTEEVACGARGGQGTSTWRHPPGYGRAPHCAKPEVERCINKPKNEATATVVQAVVTDHSTGAVTDHSTGAVTDHSTGAVHNYTENHIHEVRVKTHFDYDKIKDEISNISWNNVLDFSDLDKATEAFMQIIKSTIQKHTFETTMCVSPNDGDTKKEKCSNKESISCTRILKKFHGTYETSNFFNYSKDRKKIWKTKQKSNKFFLSIKSTPTESPKIHPNELNEYFANVAASLSNETLISLNETEESLALTHRSTIDKQQSFHFLPTNIIEVLTIVRNLKKTRGTGWDKANGKLINMILPHILVPLTTICQLSFETGYFPKALKKSIIYPKFKGGDDFHVSNYRPIAVSSFFSKVMEKLMSMRLKTYLEGKNIISDNQFAFRSKRSLDDAVLSVTEIVKKRLDEKSKCVGVFLDVSKAFDTVSIPILLAKLDAIGIQGIPLKWFQSYLTERTQSVQIGNTISNEAEVKFGIPQGSSLGPTLFLIYINQLCDMKLQQGNIITFADDTVLVFHGKTWNEVEQVANEGLKLVSNWLKRNLLSINILKTKFIPFTINSTTQPKLPLKLKIHKPNCDMSSACMCENLDQVSETRYLGIILDKHLNLKCT